MVKQAQKEALRRQRQETEERESLSLSAERRGNDAAENGADGSGGDEHEPARSSLALATARQGYAVAAHGDGGHVTDNGDVGERDQSAGHCLAEAAAVTVAEATAILHSCLQRWWTRQVLLLQASARLVLRAVARRGLVSCTCSKLSVLYK